MSSAESVEAVEATDPKSTTPNDSQTSSTNASFAPPSTTAPATVSTPTPTRPSWRIGSAMFDLKMNPYILPEHGKAALFDSLSRVQTPVPTLNSYHDGRIRNAVPSKLVGKTNGKQGNFSVMHMDVQRPKVTERDLAAKRTSEGTAAAAKLASTQGYRHPKRPRPSIPMAPLSLPPQPPLSQPHSHPPLVLPAALRPIAQPPPLVPAALPDEPPSNKQSATKEATQDTNAERTSAEGNRTGNSADQASLEQTSDPRPSGFPLSPDDIKAEQARLLTLLRSLHPVLVVDQICKALAYFGGIPGAPPPADGVFPQSAETNGSGDIFVSWVSEIFPPVNNAGQASGTQLSLAIPPVGALDPASATYTAPIAVKRTRGRPKGSKSSKVRKDKGIKKKGISSSEAVQINETTDAQPLVTEKASDAPPLYATDNNVSMFPGPSTADDQGRTAEVSQTISTAQPETPQTAKKRGRPKGSKNKPKSQPGKQDVEADHSNNINSAQAPDPATGSPLAHKATSISESTRTNMNQTVSVVAQPDTSRPYQDIHENRMEVDNDTTESQRPQPTITNDQDVSHDNSRKRKSPQQAPQLITQAAPVIDASQACGSDTTPPSSNLQAQQAKRRRVSQETRQKNPASSDPESQSTGTEAMASADVAAVGQSRSASSSFASQAQPSIYRGSSNREAQIFPSPPPYQQPQNHNLNYQNMPQFSQNKQQQANQQAHFQHQQSPDMNSEQSSQSSQIPSPAVSRPRSQLPGGSGRTPAQTAAHAFYHQQQQQQRQQQQRQMANQFGQPGGASFTRSMGSSSPTQFQAFGGRQSLSQQQSPQSQSTGSTPTPNMSQFQDFSEQSYLGMDYAINSGVATAFGNPSQLEAALAESDMRDHIYHAMRRE
ncbi:hypothetical protein F66182_2657 [Fusarium sp. NRRL 66182]|nr:hypothetical protein F66182_2657 [Fusarium sp. NRRL 66182]